MAFVELQHLILKKESPEKRLSKADGSTERHMSEAAVMLAFAMLYSLAALRTYTFVQTVSTASGSRFKLG
ncbi:MULTISPECIES: hypothetical protein [unclassified Rhizobium]|uniref:hypothetical protein n=1 Tax=unclassified Rhizobium TaxID=2613769 RepID=UPI00161E6279|nr:MULTISPECIES: hypothetical protein [unclassified Rhizobium]MBB3290639.1 hypothetical protein [Rhizobium sp. BK252]MBB3405297.1 hypothetical protein [Rhizobium sp. BK289]MBB3417844.1 hypothetical protein [Rhizobium sp. BK284]MBB3485845.1 hypothetical protein [Rhizobium sp. BK347]MDK4722724.1 hypothetical protein [Rhizobium sp. CNPSo 3968]